MAIITVGLAEAKNKLSELIGRVAQGEEITITRHDEDVTKLVPALLAGCCVTCVQQAAGLAEAAPEIALPGGHVAAKDGQPQQRVLAAHRAAIDRQFQVIDVRR